MALAIVSGGAAEAHSASFNIWAYGIRIWSGPTNHYNNQFFFLPYDYMMRMNVEVIQHSPGSFYWTAFEVGPGNEFTGPAWHGDMAIIGPSGQRLFASGGFFCSRVTQQLTMYPAYPPYNPGYGGYWEQWSGSGDASCYGSYITYDYQFVNAQ